jgi:hypothetical protein
MPSIKLSRFDFTEKVEKRNDKVEIGINWEKSAKYAGEGKVSKHVLLLVDKMKKLKKII